MSSPEIEIAKARSAERLATIAVLDQARACVGRVGPDLTIEVRTLGERLAQLDQAVARREAVVESAVAAHVQRQRAGATS